MKEISRIMCRSVLISGMAFILIAFSGEVDPSFGQVKEIPESSELDEILEGFDEIEADEELSDDLTDVLEGFEDETVEEPFFVEEELPVDPTFEFSGSLALGVSMAYAHDAPLQGEVDYRGLARLRPDLHLKVDINLSDQWKARVSGRAFYDLAYRINGRDQYTKETLDEYESEAEFQEVYLQGSLLEDLDIKIGRQIVVWGKSDNLRVVDVLNPLDIREPGLVDIEDLRLPVTMTKMDYYFGSWALSGIVVHEVRFNKTPVYGSEFFPGNSPFPGEREPSTGFGHSQYAFALNGIFSGWDVGVYLARYFDHSPHLEMMSSGIFKQTHSRLTMTGLAGNVALGNWLLKAEAAYIEGLEFFLLLGEEGTRFDILAGLEYAGFRDTTLSLEAVHRHIKDYDSRLDNPLYGVVEDDFQVVLRYSGNYMHDTLHLVAVMSMFDRDAEGGAYERFSVGYDFTDSLELIVGLVMYQSGERPEMRQIGNNDRLFVELEYRF